MAWLAPILLAAFGIVFSPRLSIGRWIIHTSVLAAMLLVLPAVFYFQSIIDPTTAEHSGPGDGFLILLYVPVMIASALYYVAFAWNTYRKRKQT